MSIADAIKTGLPPIARSDARLFILGSLPGDASLAAGRYYAHPINQFWRLLGDMLAEPLADLDYDARLLRLADRGVGLWDVIGSAVRPGSLDQAIRRAEHNALEQLLADFPLVRAIAFNGQTAAVAGRRMIGTTIGEVKLIDLPSSSAANTTAFEIKAGQWRQLGAFVRPADLRSEPGAA